MLQFLARFLTILSLVFILNVVVTYLWHLVSAPQEVFDLDDTLWTALVLGVVVGAIMSFVERRRQRRP